MLEVDFPEEARSRLIHWLEYEATHEYGCSRTHDLHLWDWEVKLLLAALRSDATEQPGEDWVPEKDALMRSHEKDHPLMTSYRFGSVGDARRMGHDAPLPGEGWVSEKDR